jgi:hypothetical protein
MIVLTFGLAAVLAGCASGGGKPAAASRTAWPPATKAGLRQTLAMGAQGSQLDCAVDVVAGFYSPEDWTYVSAHPYPNGEKPAEYPARLTALDTESRKTLESRCGIKDTSGEDAAQAAAMKAWNSAVDEWSALTQKRDAAGAKSVVVDGRSFDSYDAWAKAFGKPLQAP